MCQELVTRASVPVSGDCRFWEADIKQAHGEDLFIQWYTAGRSYSVMLGEPGCGGGRGGEEAYVRRRLDWEGLLGEKRGL